MKVCTYKGLALVVMLRDEHCPPHVHVDGGRWSARWGAETYRITSARYEIRQNKTLLQLLNAPDGVEIEL